MGNAGVIVEDASFNNTYQQYVTLNKRSIPELNDKIGFEVSKLCVAKTETTPKNDVRASLQQASRTSPTMTVGEVIANKMSVAKGEGGLTGAELKSAARKLESFRARTPNFLRSGFLPGVRAFSQRVKDRVPGVVNGVKTYGEPKGGATVSNYAAGWNATASIWNSVIGGVKKWIGAPVRNIGKIQKKLIKGVSDALRAKEADMRPYIERKLNENLKKVSKA